MKLSTILVPGLLLILLAGCGASSHRIMTVNGKMSCSFNNKSVKGVCDVLSKSFGPLKGYTADIPAELKDTKITFELSDVTSAEPVRAKLEEVTQYKVEFDAAKKVIRFVKK
jgi:hypothetical protein